MLSNLLKSRRVKRLLDFSRIPSRFIKWSNVVVIFAALFTLLFMFLELA